MTTPLPKVFDLSRLCRFEGLSNRTLVFNPVQLVAVSVNGVPTDRDPLTVNAEFSLAGGTHLWIEFRCSSVNAVLQLIEDEINRALSSSKSALMQTVEHFEEKAESENALNTLKDAVLRSDN